jgi:hypothetical protein
MLGNIKHQLGIIVYSSNPSSIPLGILKVGEALAAAGFHLAMDLAPQTQEAINAESADPRRRETLNQSIVVTITDPYPSTHSHHSSGSLGWLARSQGMMAQPVHDTRFQWPGFGGYHGAQAGAYPSGYFSEPKPSAYRNAYPDWVPSRYPGDVVSPSGERFSPLVQSFEPSSISADGNRYFVQHPAAYAYLHQHNLVASSGDKDKHGVYYRYTVWSKAAPTFDQVIQEVTFQHSETNDEAATNGVHVTDLLIMCADRLQCIQKCAGATPAKAEALRAIRHALETLIDEACKEPQAAERSGN